MIPDMKTLRVIFFLLIGPVSAWAQGTAPAANEPISSQPAAQIFSGTVTPIPFPTDTVDSEYARRAGVDAIDQWVRDFMNRDVKERRFAVLPVGRDVDGNYFTQQVRNAFADRASGTEFKLFTRDDSTWNALLAEIRKGDQFGDTMDPATIQQFGRVQGVEGVIMGRIAGIYSGTANSGAGPVKIEGDGKVIQVRVSLQAYAVETGQLLWGGERVGTAIMPSEDFVIKRDWIMKGMIWGGGGLLVVFALWILMGRLRSSNRPR